MNIDKKVEEIPIEDIIPNRFQPRLAFNEEGITELSESIKQHGIIQPLVVRKLGDKFEIIAGERRYKAATMAGLAKVPVIISDIDDNKSAEVALVENIQRRNLTAIEEAKSYKNLLDRGYLTQEQLANKMGVSQSSIANKLRLLNLDEEVQEALLNEKISERHARALLVLEDKEEQKKWLKKILEERLTVRQLDLELKKLQGNEEKEEEIPLVEINPNIEDIVNNAEDINVYREPHDVASMLIPEGGVMEPKKEEEKPAEPEKMPNKFFNFLEEEEANMNVMEPSEIIDGFTSDVAPIPSMEPVIETPVEEPSSVEVLDELDEDGEIDIQEPIGNAINIEEPNNVTFTTPVENNISLEPMTPTEEPIIEPTIVETPNYSTPESPVVENVINEIPSIEPQEQIQPEPMPTIMEEPQNNNIEEVVSVPNNTESINNNEPSPFKSIFFNNEEDEESTGPEMPFAPLSSNEIEEVQPVIEEEIVDPMDSVVTLEPDYEEKLQEAAGTDLKSAINIVRETVTNLESKGFGIELEEADLDDLYHMTIKINKN